ASTPIVVFAHIPLWAVYPEWGWATKDSAQALDLLKRFGSVTVLNGHIHQTLQKVEGGRDVLFCDVHGLSSARTGKCSRCRAHESTGRTASQGARNPKRECSYRPAPAGGSRFAA